MSRRRIVAEEGIVSVYAKAQYKVYKTEVNESEVANELDRELGGRDPLEAIVSYLTSVRVGTRWHSVL